MVAMNEHVDWCCPGFKDSYLSGKQRGHNVLCTKSDADFWSYMHFRPIDRRVLDWLDSQPGAPPFSTLMEVGIRFCPWCGVNLEKWYRNQLETMPILDEPIST